MREKLRKLKRKVQSLLPDKYFYLKSTLNLVPEYLRSEIKNSKVELPEVKFYSDTETVDLIANKGCSLARFGDGEFSWMTDKTLDSFQDYSESLAKDLRKAFLTEAKNVLIAIPYGIYDSSECNLHAKLWWKIMGKTTMEKARPFLRKELTYANASITRPYIDYKSRTFSRDAFNNLRRIWEGRDVCFVEGCQSRLGMGNDLFSNANSICRILCPGKNAYQKIDEIQNAIINNVPKEKLILSALGPTASILAVRMAELGYQFVDIGHVDIEYVWYLNHSVLRDSIKGKYVNESGAKFTEDIYANDPVYLDSIICRVDA